MPFGAYPFLCKSRTELCVRPNKICLKTLWFQDRFFYLYAAGVLHPLGAGSPLAPKYTPPP